MIRHTLPRKNIHRTDVPMMNSTIAQYAPSVMADCAHHSRKEHYGFVPTITVIDGLRKEGFEVFEVSQRNTRIADRKPFTKHMVRMRHASTFGANEVPELILTNSHDGSSSYELMSGIFRFICSNGLIAGDIFSTVKIRHMGDIVADVIDGTYKVMENTSAIADRIDTYKSINLSHDEQIIFAGAARKLMWGDSSPVDVSLINQERRYEDTGADLWRTFNRVQENLMQGGLSGRRTNGRRITTRGVGSIGRSVDLNRKLWTLADIVAQEKITH